MTLSESIHLASEDKLRVALIVAGCILAALVFAWALAQLIKFVLQELEWRSILRTNYRNNHIVQSRGEETYPTLEQVPDWSERGDELKRQREARQRDSEPTLPGAAE